jgi:hypothetical protein
MFTKSVFMSRVQIGNVVSRLESTLSRLELIEGETVDKLYFWDRLEDYWIRNYDNNN